MIKRFLSHGLTSVYIDSDTDAVTMVIEHAGNMGNSIDNVNENFEKMFAMNIDGFCSCFKVLSDEEEGCADYLYKRKITFTDKGE